MFGSCNSIPVNHQVINDQFFPADYGWLHVTLLLHLVPTDRQTDGQTTQQQVTVVFTCLSCAQLSPLIPFSLCLTENQS